MPNLDWTEIVHRPRLDRIRGDNETRRQRMLYEKLWHKDGRVYPISGPGLGIEVIEAKVRKIAP
jgi:hypothetical protein